MKWGINCLISILGLFSCQKKNDPEPDLVGGWTDKTVNYHFYSNKTYGQKYLLNGSGKDTILIDSAFGNYVINNTKKVITFNQNGYYDKKKKLVSQALNFTTWQYELDGNTLKFNSNTSIGQLTKIY